MDARDESKVFNPQVSGQLEVVVLFPSSPVSYESLLILWFVMKPLAR
jgi:hypothetical protein